MINVDGKVYSNFNSIDSNQIESFILNTVFEFTLRWENNHILFWEEHYFMMMAQLRRLRLVIPMNFTLDYFNKEILKIINEDYYYSNVIARASKTMLKCKSAKINFKSTGTEG